MAVGHTGSLRGFTAVTWYMPDSGTTFTVLTNRGRIRPEEIGADISRAVLDWLAAQPARTA